MVKEAESKDVIGINNIRKQVHMLHVTHGPKIFKPSFSNEMENYLLEFIGKSDKYALVYVEDNQICAYVLLSKIVKPETPYRYELKYLNVEEFGVLENMRHRGIGSILINEVKKFAKKIGISDIRLNVWAFNEEAIKFYKKVGFVSLNNTLQMII